MNRVRTSIYSILFAILLGVSLPEVALSQCGDSIDLGTWIQEGPAANGNWTVTNGGNTVNQSINGDPTFYVSPDSFLNVIVTGNIQVATTADDDWVGFVFGYVDPDSSNPNNYDFYLFDWKQNDQNFGGFFGQEGFALTHVQGPVVNFPQAFSAKVGPFVDVIATQFGNNEGWVDLQTYAFALTYTNTRTVIAIDGDTIFDVYGCFPPGRFGFYNYSQSDVNYSDFSYRVAAAFEVLTPDVCLGDTARFIALSDSCENAAGVPVNNTITGWFWDFGDGNTSNDTNASHYYANPGTYQVQLVVTDYLGCTDTATSSVDVFNVQTDLGNDTAICTNDTVTLDAGVNATAYVWSTGATTQTIPASAAGNYWVAVSGDGGCTDTDTVVITNHPLPVINLGNDTSICNSDSITLYAGNPGFNFLWNDGSTLDSLVVSDSGEYWVEVTNPSTTCSSRDSIHVSNYAQPTVSPPNPSLCYGDTITISASGANTYTWYPAAGLSATTGAVVETFTLVDTTYYVIGTDTNGCTDTSVFFVEVYDLPTFSIFGSDSVCTGDSVTLEFDLTGEGPWDVTYRVQGTTYSITGIDTTSYSLTVGDSGTYEPLTVTDQRCSNTGDTSALVHHYPLPTLTSTPTDTAICIGDTFQISIQGAQNYAWNPAYNTTSLSGDSIFAYPAVDTSYTVVATDSNGCINYDTVTVTINPLPTINIAMSSGSVCQLDTITLTASGAATYAWTPAQGISNLDSAEVQVSPTSTTTYEVFGTDSNNCVNSSDTVVQVLPLPNIVIQPGIGAICVGESETLTAQSYYDLTWSPTATLQLDGNNNDTVIASPVDTTTYSITAVDSNGCTSDTTYTLAVTPLPVLTVTSDDSIICPGIGTTLHAVGATSYQWGPNVALSNAYSANPVAAPQNPQTYFVTATGDGGCQSIDSLFIDVFAIGPYSAGEDTAICRGDTIQLEATGGVSYQWGPNLGISDPLVADPICYSTTSRLYVVQITDSNGCQNSDNVYVKVNPLPTVNAGVRDTICLNQQTAIGGTPTGPPGSFYTWTPSAGLSNANIPNPLASPDTTTTYQVHVIDTNTCERSRSVTIVVNPLPTLELIESPTYMCEGDTGVISVTPGLAQYGWLPMQHVFDPSSSYSQVRPSDTTTYSITGRDSNGCASVVTVNVPVKSKPFVNIKGNYDMCSGDTVQLEANASEGTLTWKPAQVISRQDTLAPLAYPTKPTNVVLRVTDDLGCSNTDTSLVFAHPLPRVDAGMDIENCGMDVVYLGGPSVTGPENDIFWTPTDKLSDPRVEHPRVFSTEIDTFYLTVQSPEGCINRDTVVVNSDCYISMYAPNSFTPDGDGINDYFTLKGRNIHDPYMVIYDRWGHLLFETNDLSQGWDGNFTQGGQQAPIGTYFFLITYKNERGRGLSIEGRFNLVR